MLPRNHSDLDMSLDGSIDFNSSHGSYKFDGKFNLYFYF